MLNQQLNSGEPNIARKILIIDASEEEYKRTRDMLIETKHRSWRPIWAATFEIGRDALFSDDFQAILVAYNLGSHSGLEVLRVAVEHDYPAPIIILTDQWRTEINLDAMQAGAALCLAKDDASPLLLDRAIHYAIERKQKDLALQKSEARERARVAENNAILDAVPAIVWITRDAEATEVTGNRVAYDFLGVPQGTNLSKTVKHGKTQNDYRVFANGMELPPAELPLQRTVATGLPIRDFEENIVFDDGTQKNLLGNVAPLISEDGKPAGAVAAFIDITSRKQAEAALRQSEATLEAFFAASPGILNIGDEELHYLKTDPITPTYFGLDRQTIVGKAIKDLSPGFYAIYGAMIHRVIETGKPELNVDVKIPNASRPGETRSLRVSYFPVPLPQKKRGIGIIGIDITDIRKVEEALIAAKEEAERSFFQLNTVIENIGDGLTVADSQGNILLMNSAMLKLTGMATIPKEHFHQYAARVDIRDPQGQPVPADQWPLARALRGETIRDVEYFVQHLDSNKHYIALYNAAPVRDASGRVLIVIVTAHDITDRKRVEEALRESETRFRLAVEGIAEEMWICDQQGKMSMVNLTPGTSMDLQEFQDRSVEEVYKTIEIFNVDGEPRLPQQAPLLRSLRGETVQGEEIVRDRKTGTTRYRRFSSAPIRDQSGTITGAVAIGWDITDQKRAMEAEREHRRLAEALRDTAAALTGTLDL